MSTDQLLYLSQADVEAAGLTMAVIIGALEQMFREKGEGRVEMPPKPGIHTMPNAFIHAMPAYIPALQSTGTKWVDRAGDDSARGPGLVEASANGTGFGAALSLNDEEFECGERIAAMAEQVGLDLEADFNMRFVQAMELPGGQGQ